MARPISSPAAAAPHLPCSIARGARDLGRVAAFGVAGTGSYGAGLASFLRRHAHKVIEVNRPARHADRRLTGKSDAIDAEHAAREVLAGNATNTPKTGDGAIEAIRLIKIARDGAEAVDQLPSIHGSAGGAVGARPPKRPPELG